MKQKNIFLLIIILSFTSFVNGQTNYRPGYVIKSINDTIYGIIDYRNDKIMSAVCKFKTDDQANETAFSPEDIAGFRFIKSKFYISKVINGKKIFLEFLVKGKINLYYQRDEKGDHYYMEKDSTGIIELPYEEKIKNIDDTPYQYQSTKHLGILKAFLKDAPKTLVEVNEIKKPEHRNLIKIVKDYHNEVCSNEECIIYEKALPLINISFEPTAGMIFFKYDKLDYNLWMHKKDHFQVGLFTHIMLPRVNENLSFRIGCLFSEAYVTENYINTYILNGGLYADTISKSGDIRIFKIPIQLEYNYPKGMIRPKAAFGFDIYSPFNQTLSAMAGADIKLTKSIFLSLNYNIDFFNEKLTLKFHLFSQSFLMGVKVKI